MATQDIPAQERRSLSLEFVAAAKQNDFARMLRLHGEGASVNALGAQGRSALSWTAVHGNAEAAGFLLAAGAAKDHPDDDGSAPVHLAVRGGHHDCLRVLAAAGADMNGKDGHGDAPLILAQDRGDAKTAALLLELGADPNLTDSFNEPAVLRAAKRGDWGTAASLIARGASVFCTDRRFGSVEDIARKAGNDETVQAARESREAEFIPQAHMRLKKRPSASFRRS